MGKSYTAKYQFGRVYTFKGIPYQVISSQGTPGHETVILQSLFIGKPNKVLKQQWR